MFRYIKGKKFIKLAVLILGLTLVSGFSNIQTDNHKDIKTITVSAIGDCMLGKSRNIPYENSWGDLYEKFGADYFLKKCRKIFLKDDLTIANLEGVLSDSKISQEKFFRQSLNKIISKNIHHLGKPDYIKALIAGGVDVVSFANNHNIDYGLKGFKDTIDTCNKYGLSIAYYDNVVRYDVKGLKVGILSIDSTYCDLSTAKKYLENGIANLRRDCDLVIVCVHWGQNYEESPNKEQQYLGHLSIDYGADMVLGAHAHILQGIERYKGRYIFYSLGNFTYGGRVVPRDADTMIAQQTFTFINGKLQIDDNVKIYPSWMSTKKEMNDFCPIIKRGFEGYSVIRKINRLSKRFALKFDFFGHPKVKKEENTARTAKIVNYKEDRIEKIPEIIYRLLDVDG